MKQAYPFSKQKVFMSFKIGDRVDENGRRGVVEDIHTIGTLDVLFDDMDYAIRRQEYNVRKIKRNSALQQKMDRVRGLPKDFDLTELQFIAQVMGIYKTQIRSMVGLPSLTPFIDDNGQRLDENLTVEQRREALNTAFAITTGVQRKYGYLAPSPDQSEPFPRVPSMKTLRRVSERLDDPNKVFRTVQFYEDTLALARTGRQQASTDTGIRVERYNKGGYVLLFNGGIVDINGIKHWKTKKALTDRLKSAGFIVKNNNQVFIKPTSTSTFTENK